MSIAKGIQSSYALFGARGVALVAKARLLRRPIEASVSVAGMKWPVQIRLRTTDVSLLSEIMLQNAEYDLELPAAPRVIVDAGANSGLTSVFYANKYPQARVVAIEPERSNYQILLKNTAPYANITCIRAALWKTDTTITIADPGSGNWGFQTLEQGLQGDTSHNEVKAITLSSLMAQLSIDYIDFLRIDIEGAEKEVFDDASSWIDKVGVVGIELHDRLKAGCTRSVYLATKDFQWELRRGETVFFGRPEWAMEEVARPVSVDSTAAVPGFMLGRRCCTIVSSN
jgi:FkbM family methyltransferase